MDAENVVLDDARMGILMECSAAVIALLQQYTIQHKFTSFECVGILGMASYGFVTLRREQPEEGDNL